MIPKYIEERLDYLQKLKRGWYGYNGTLGEAISPETMSRARERFDNFKGPRVYLYPTVEGHISAEWHDSDRDEIIT